MKLKIHRNTDEEEAAIQRGIALDPDNPELDDDFFRNARPAREVMPPEIYAELVARSGRGPGKKPAKAQVTLRIDQDVLDALRASGPGWQVRANAALRQLVMMGPSGD